jgi:uncharacterized repeat protein (TIGR01451 family)
MNHHKRSNLPFLAVFLLFLPVIILAVQARTSALAVLKQTTENANPNVSLSKEPQNQIVSSGSAAQFTITVANTGNVALQEITVSDPLTPNCNREVNTLAPGAEVSYTCQRPNVTASYLNSAGATAASSAGPVSASANAYVSVRSDALRISVIPDTQNAARGGRAEFLIVVLNTSSDIFLTNVTVNDPVSSDCNFDPAVPYNLAPGANLNYVCAQPVVDAPFGSVITAQARNFANTITYTAGHYYQVEVVDLTAALSPAPVEMPEPGGPVTYTLTLNNPGSVPVTLTGLSSEKFGNLADPNNANPLLLSNGCAISGAAPTLAATGGVYRCAFVADLGNQQPGVFRARVTATVAAGDGVTVDATANSAVAITDVPAFVTLDVIPSAAFVYEPGGVITFTLTVENSSAVDAVTLTGLTDSVLGDLNGQGSCALPGAALPSGGVYTCAYSDALTGAAGDSQTRTIAVAGESDDIPPTPVNASRQITLEIREEPIWNVHLPLVAVILDEPNNTPPQAFPIDMNRTYRFFANDHEDWYLFTLAEVTNNVNITVRNLIAQNVQILVYRQSILDDDYIKRIVNPGPNSNLALGTLAPDGYYVRIFISDNTFSGQPYTLRVNAGN